MFMGNIWFKFFSLPVALLVSRTRERERERELNRVSPLGSNYFLVVYEDLRGWKFYRVTGDGEEFILHDIHDGHTRNESDNPRRRSDALKLVSAMAREVSFLV